MSLRRIWKSTNAFESFREFLDSLRFSFSANYLIVYPRETSNSNLQIPGYLRLHQTRKNQKGEGFVFSYLNPSPTKSEMT